MGCRDDAEPMVCAYTGDAVTESDRAIWYVPRSFRCGAGTKVHVGTFRRDHADTIRRATAHLKAHTAVTQWEKWDEAQQAVINHLAAENQRLRDALERIAKSGSYAHDRPTTLFAATDIAREALAGDTEAERIARFDAEFVPNCDTEGS